MDGSQFETSAIETKQIQDLSRDYYESYWLTI